MEKKKQKKDSCMLNNSVPQSRAVSTGEFRDLGRDYVKGLEKKTKHYWVSSSTDDSTINNNNFS